MAEPISMLKRKYVYYIDVKDLTSKLGFITYFKLLKGIWDYILDDYTRKEKMILLKVSKNCHMEMKMFEFLLHLIFWRPNVVFQEKISQDDFYPIIPFTRDRINTIINDITRRFVDKDETITDELSKTISYIIDDLVKLSWSYSSISCNSISLYDIIQFKNRDPIFKSLIDTELDDTKSIKELETFLKNSETVLKDAIKADKYNCLYAYVMSSRIDSMQLNQMFTAVGPRPDIDKTILPRIIKRGFIHGLKDMGEYYVDAVNARDALLTKFNNVPMSGYLSRKINLLCLDTMIDYNTHDCGTKHYLTFTVHDKFFLNMIIGKYLINDDNTLTEITRKMDHLIGKTIKLRSHVVCAHKTPGKVCKVCYGAGYKTLKGTRIGGLSSVKFANPMSQKAMSAKHKAMTKSITIDNENINRFFDKDGTRLYLKEEYADSKETFIAIDKEYVEDVLHNDIDVEDVSIDINLPLQTVVVKYMGTAFPIENEGLFLSLSDEVLALRNYFIDDEEDEDTVLIPVRRLSKDEPVFSMILVTEEISKYLTMITSCIDGARIRRFNSYDELIAEITNVSNQSGIIVRLTHIETIIYNLVKDFEDITKRPNFNNALPKYTMLSITNSLLAKDVYTSLSFQRLAKQFKTFISYKKSQKGIFDSFYRVDHPYK